MSKIILEFNHDEISDLGTMVICEMWNKRRYGKIRREFLKTFDEEDRVKLSALYPKIYKWNLVIGIPDKIRMKMSTYHLIRRACNFFGTI